MNRLRKTNLQNSGFTIVELIVVIVVIAILATITLVSYNIIRDRAKATALTSEITKVEEAFQLMAADEFRATWWRDGDFTGSGNPSFAEILNSTSSESTLFKKYVPEVPKVSGLDLNWILDSDGDSIDPEDCLTYRAVALIITPVDEAIVKLVDDEMDDGDTSCGRVMKYSSGMQYQLSYDAKI